MQQDPECGCVVSTTTTTTTTTVDGTPVAVHHHIPDDGAPHAPNGECGCGPHLSGQGTAVWVYAHTDQELCRQRWVEAY